MSQARLYLMTYFHINQIFHLLTEVVEDAQFGTKIFLLNGLKYLVTESLHYWETRRWFWYTYEKTPIFWYHYWQEKVPHPTRERLSNIELLQKQDNVSILSSPENISNTFGQFALMNWFRVRELRVAFLAVAREFFLDTDVHSDAL